MHTHMLQILVVELVISPIYTGIVMLHQRDRFSHMTLFVITNYMEVTILHGSRKEK